MPKMKSRNTAKKRFSLTATGKVKRKKAFARHILTKKSRKSKRNMRGGAMVDAGHRLKLHKMLLGG
jgi:large subunit ribosomal protein L35